MREGCGMIGDVKGNVKRKEQWSGYSRFPPAPPLGGWGVGGQGGCSRRRSGGGPTASARAERRTARSAAAAGPQAPGRKRPEPGPPDRAPEEAQGPAAPARPPGKTTEQNRYFVKSPGGLGRERRLNKMLRFCSVFSPAGSGGGGQLRRPRPPSPYLITGQNSVRMLAHSIRWDGTFSQLPHQVLPGRVR